MRTGLSSLLLLTGALAVTACTTDSPAGPRAALRADASAGEGVVAREQAHTDMNEARASLRAAEAQYDARAASLNVVDAIAGMLAERVTYVGARPGVPASVLARTREEARALLALSAANRANRMTWTPVKVDVSADGRDGYSAGYYTTLRPDGGLVTRGKYLAYWRRAGGAWQVVAYKRLGGLPSYGALTPPPGFEAPASRHVRYRPNGTPASDAAEILATDAAFAAMGQADVDSATGRAFAAFVAPDGGTIGADIEFTWGADAILRESGGATGLAWTPDYAEASEMGDLGFSTGASGPTGGPFPGRYLSIWQRQRDGTWRFVMDG